ncbi:MAG: hypothetical protein ACXWCP_26410 [Burkholderiales bacterium]
MNTNQGPYAFPIPEKLAATDVQHGMTIRDYFAAKAMQALVRYNGSLVPSATETIGVIPGVRVAAIAYDIANAMIEEREK